MFGNMKIVFVKLFDNQVRSAEMKIVQKKMEIKRLRAKLTQLKQQYRKMFLYAYKHRGNYNKVMYLLASADYNEALRRNRYLKKVAAVPSAHQGFSSFSPDGRFVAFSRESTITGNPDIYITPLDASKPAENVTRLASFHGQMAWSPDGRFLFFSSNRDGDGLYALPLQRVVVRADVG